MVQRPSRTSRTIPYTVNRFDPRTGLIHPMANLAIPVNGSLAVPDKPDNRDSVLHAQAVER
jgi:hypothetical protein